MTHIHERYITRFKKYQLQSYLNLPEKIGTHGTLSINTEKIIDNKIYIRIKYKHQYDLFYFDNLPLELNEIINSYMVDIVDLTFTIVLPDDYPFNPPLWILSDIKTTTKDLNSFITYYAFKLQCHNEKINIQWSPAHSIIKDILVLITTIMNFEEMISLKY